MRARDKIFRNLINESSVAAGGDRRAVLDSLTPRPNGKYAYVRGLLVTITGTLTETGTGQAIEYEDTWDILKTLTLKAANKVRFNAYGGRSLVRRMLQMDEALKKNVRDSFIKTSDVAATGAGDTAMTVKYPVSLCPFWHHKGLPLRKRLIGAISVADLQDSGELAVTIKSNPVSAADGSNYWSVTSSGWTVTVDLDIVELDRPIITAWCEEYEHVGQEQRIPVIGSGMRRLTGLLVADDTNSDLTVPTAFNLVHDGDYYANTQDGDEWIAKADALREENVNELVHKALPIVGAATHGPDECPVIEDTFLLESIAAAHTGNVLVLMRTDKELSESEKRAFLRRFQVPNERIEQVLAELRADPQDFSAASVEGVPATLVDTTDPARTAAEPVVVRP